MQPGSSVATALSEGESKKKHVFMLEVVDQNFRTIKQELQSVRPFAFDQARDHLPHPLSLLVFPCVAIQKDCLWFAGIQPSYLFHSRGERGRKGGGGVSVHFLFPARYLTRCQDPPIPHSFSKTQATVTMRKRGERYVWYIAAGMAGLCGLMQ